jgi:hypothetical protein
VWSHPTVATAATRGRGALEKSEAANHLLPVQAVNQQRLFMSHRRLVVHGFAIALLVTTATLAAGPGTAQTPRSEQEASPSPSQDKSVSVTAPQADLKVDRERGQVQVRAPHSSVSVDTNAGQVRVRAPYVDLDVRW